MSIEAWWLCLSINWPTKEPSLTPASHPILHHVAFVFNPRQFGVTFSWAISSLVTLDLSNSASSFPVQLQALLSCWFGVT